MKFALGHFFLLSHLSHSDLLEVVAGTCGFLNALHQFCLELFVLLLEPLAEPDLGHLVAGRDVVVLHLALQRHFHRDRFVLEDP